MFPTFPLVPPGPLLVALVLSPNLCVFTLCALQHVLAMMHPQMFTTPVRNSGQCAMQDGREPDDIKRELKAADCSEKYPAGVNVSVSRKASTLLDFEERGLAHVLRASPHYYNTEDEVHDFLAALRAVVVHV